MLGSKLHVVVRGENTNTLWYSNVNLQDNSFSGWTLLSGSTPSTPTLTDYLPANGLCLVVRGGDNKVYYSVYEGTTWQSWNSLPTGTTNETPAALVIGNMLYLVVIGNDGTSLWLCSIDLTTNNFAAWTPLTGSTPSKPVLTG
jgi:hypothetical protein